MQKVNEKYDDISLMTIGLNSRCLFFKSGFVLNYITNQKWIYWILIKRRENIYKHNIIINQWMLLKFYCKLVMLEVHFGRSKKGGSFENQIF